MDNLTVGKNGEDIAAEYLLRLGFRIAGRNIRTPFGELDIVATRLGKTVFVEVKTRISEDFGPPHLSITGKKKRHLLKSAMFYLLRKGMCGSPCRIDVISINLTDEGKMIKLEHIANAVTQDE